MCRPRAKICGFAERIPCPEPSLDDLYGAPTIPWRKRCYFLNSTTIKLRPLIGHWMVNRKPPMAMTMTWIGQADSSRTVRLSSRSPEEVRFRRS